MLTVVREELPAMRVAFKKFDTATQPYRPKLTIVVCGKRHHTRFFPTDANNADRDGNPRPGTVVDRGVTAIYDFDFFLQGLSHFCCIYVVFEMFLLSSSAWKSAGDHSTNALLCRSRRDRV